MSVVLFFCFVYTEMTKKNPFDVDMVYYNRQLKQVETKLESLLTKGPTVSEADETGLEWEEAVKRIETDYRFIKVEGEDKE